MCAQGVISVASWASLWLRGDVYGRYKLACMSAAACGCLQLKILGECKTTQRRHVFGKCFCGPQESLFPIPLVESYSNVIRLYYGKTVHDEERASCCFRSRLLVFRHSQRDFVVLGGLCSHRVGCFFDLTMHTWSDALLALSVMQATANDVFARWQCMPEFELRAAKLSLPRLPTLRQASTQTCHSRSDQPSRFNTKQDGGASTAEYSAADSDVAALKAAGVAEAAPLYTRPVVLYEAGATPPVAVRGEAVLWAIAVHRILMCVRVCADACMYVCLSVCRWLFSEDLVSIVAPGSTVVQRVMWLSRWCRDGKPRMRHAC